MRNEVNIKDAYAAVEHAELWHAHFGSFRGPDIPIVEHGDIKLHGTVPTCEYIEEVLPGRSLLGSDPYRKFVVRKIMEEGLLCFAQHGKGGPHALLQTQNEQECTRKVEQGVTDSLKKMEWLLELYQLPGGPFVNGADWSLAETVVAPWLMRVVRLWPHYRGVDVFELCKKKRTPKTSQWIKAIVERDIVLRTTPSFDEMVRVWGRGIPDWRPKPKPKQETFAERKARLEGKM